MEILQKFNWEYLDCLKKQEELVEEVLNNDKKEFLILTSHPPCYTIGKGKESQGLDDIHKYMSFPVHQIHRGGGLTFHHPGQLIIYHIRKLKGENLKLKNHIETLLQNVSQAVTASTNISLKEKIDPLGLWTDRYKIASLGVGLKKFITFHGLALNIHYHQEIFQEIKNLNPCGLSPGIYNSLDRLASAVSYEQIKKDVLRQFTGQRQLVPQGHSQNYL